VVGLFDAMEAGGAEFGFDLRGGEEELEGLTCGGDPCGQAIEDFAFGGREGVGREGVVEGDAGTGGQAGKVGESGAEGFESEVGNDAEPTEEGRR